MLAPTAVHSLAVDMAHIWKIEVPAADDARTSPNTSLCTRTHDSALPLFPRPSLVLLCLQTAADNARSREKTGLEAKAGDEDLVDYYYIVMHPFTQSGFERRKYARQFRREAVPRLLERFGPSPGLDPPKEREPKS